MKVNGHEDGFQTYPLVACRLRLEAANLRPSVGSSLGSYAQVGSGSGLGGSPPTRREGNLPKSLVLSFWENYVGNYVRSGALSPDRSGATCGAVSPGRCSVVSLPISSLVSSAGCLQMSSPRSFLTSRAGRFQRPRCQFAVAGLQWPKFWPGYMVTP